MSSLVSRPKAANSKIALKYFQSLREFETDCWDVHHAMTNKRKDFVLFDVRGNNAFNCGHITGAENFPYTKINATALKDYSEDILFVVYCAGPHCNATEKAAIKLATLNRPVKKMIGGVTGWIDEGFTLTIDNAE